jgi:sterol 14-demethylase
MLTSAIALPTLLSDVRSRLDDLAADPQGRTDPFDSIYKIVYLLTQRAVGASEIARDRKLQDTTLHLFETIERSTKPYQVMFPWLPSPALFQRYLAGTRMYMIFSKIVNNRKKNNHRKDDALQFLIDKGDDLNRIIAVSCLPLGG